MVGRRRKRKRSPTAEQDDEEDEEVSFKAKRIRRISSIQDDAEISFKTKSPVNPTESDQVAVGCSPPPPPPRRSPNGYILPDPLPSGLIVADIHGKKWKISQSIGLGGFGEIYSASSVEGSGDHLGDYVIKVEPHNNGPLFVEINFYIRGGKEVAIQEFKSQKDFAHLGVPHFVASGSFTYRKRKYRFLVLPRYGNDLDKMSDFCGGAFDKKTAVHIAIQVLNALEYVHSKGFVHKDIKGSNLLLDRNDSNKIYLVDFGLCSKFVNNGIHKPYIHDARWAHEGTLEYTSRDAHIGCPSRRGDLEVLLYNFIEWLGGRLTWDLDTLQKPIFYKTEKFKAFQNKDLFLKNCFQSNKYPKFLRTFMESIDGLNFEKSPDYEHLRKLLRVETTKNVKLNFTKRKKVALASSVSSTEIRNNSNQENIQPSMMAEDQRVSQTFDEKCISPRAYDRKCKLKTEAINRDSLKNPTPVMLELMETIKAKNLRANNKPSNFRKSFRSSSRRKTSSSRTSSSVSNNGTSLTPAMEAIIRLKERNATRRIRKSNSYGRISRREISRIISSPDGCDEKVMTRSHSLPNVMTSRSIRKQVRDAVDAGLGNISGFLKNISKSFNPFSVTSNN